MRPPFAKKITRVKWTGGIVEAEEYLLCKCEALVSKPSSTPSPPKKERNEKSNPNILQQ
jgi:hypothetical protein